MSRKGWVCYKLSQKQLNELKKGREKLAAKRKRTTKKR